MQVSAKADYALRAVAELAVSGAGPVKGEHVSRAQGIPLKFLESIMLELKRADIVYAQRGPAGGYSLARPPEEITLADVIRAVEGPLANVHGQAPERLDYVGPAQPLQEVWIALRASLRAVLESVTLADLQRGTLPAHIGELTRDPEAWVRR
jgi:Rrf2 family protein